MRRSSSFAYSVFAYSVVVIAWLSGSPRALAQPRQETAPRFGALRTRAETTLEVRRERVDLACDAAGEGTLDCDVTVTIAIGNASEADVTTSFNVTIERSTPFTMRAEDGTETEAPTVRPFDAPIAAGGERAIIFHGHLELGRPHSSGGVGSSIDGLTARHPLLATPIHHEVRRVLYSRPVRRDFASLGRIELHADLPPGWRLRTSDPRFQSTGDGSETLARDEGAEDARGPADVEIMLEEGTGPDPVRHGGPYLALGGTFFFGAPEAATIVRGRLGYELGILDYLVLGASIETNFRDLANVAVLIEATTWSMVVPPALSAGIGPIFQVLDGGPRTPGTPTISHHDAGLRLAAGAGIYSVGFDATFDVFPADGHWEITLAGRAGL